MLGRLLNNRNVNILYCYRINDPGEEHKCVRHYLPSWWCEDSKVMSTFCHVGLQHRSMSENQHIEDGLTGAIKGSVEIDVTTSLFAAAVLAVNVAMHP